MSESTIKELRIEQFSYELPSHRIAFQPVSPRDSSKLLVYASGKIKDKIYSNLSEELPEGTLLIGNNTRVVEARLIFYKSTGARIELFCLEPDSCYADITSAMQNTKQVRWHCLVGGAKKWKNETLQIEKKGILLMAKKTNSLVSNPVLVELSWNDDTLTFAEVLHHFGNIPLPPYIKRENTLQDQVDYQTVYAETNGSVAAPTAGLHFSNALINNLKEKNIAFDYLTLHVGAGTFMPVKSEQIKDHVMHTECIEVKLEFLHAFLAHEGLKVAIGTTSLRTLESLYWMGVKCALNPDINSKKLSLLQWEAYELDQNISLHTSYKALIHWMKKKKMKVLLTETQLIIGPGYQLRTVEGLITNFHQPESTLLLLVSAVVGDEWKKIYNHALKNNYRFLSFGDGSLLWKKE